jgi:hypothetical protein
MPRALRPAGAWPLKGAGAAVCIAQPSPPQPTR